MPRTTLKKTEPMRPLHRRMSFAAFERIPRRPGWKHEYYGGRAHITPSHTTVSFWLDLAPREAESQSGIRSVMPEDADALLPPFLDAFRETPEYAGYRAAVFKNSAKKYIAGFFGKVRGQWSPVSVVMEKNAEIIAAALVKRSRTLPLLDCLFVCPGHTRKALATRLVNHVVNRLRDLGETQLLSYVLLANEPSMAWHHHFGFHEVPDLWIATSRWHACAHQLERHQDFKDLPEAELANLAERTAYWRAEVDRLTELEKRDFWAAHPQFD
jgi:GNAT superfamily N-acetyltransferase